MSDQFTVFPQLCKELQLLVWEQTVGDPVIHVLHSARADAFQWYQGWACPIHQALDARTNRPVTGHQLQRLAPTLVCKAAHAALRRKLVKADLTTFDPDVSPDNKIPLSRRRELDIAATTKHNKEFVKIINWIAQVTKWTLRNVRTEEECRKLCETNRMTTQGFVTVVQDVMDGLHSHAGTLPHSVHSSIVMHCTAIRDRLRAVTQSLDNYEAYINSESDRTRYRNEAEEHVKELKMVVTRAQRGLPDYCVPGCINSLIPRAREFRRIEGDRARQVFAVAVERDLVYVADPRHPDMFIRLWDNDWMKNVRHLAILVVDCKVKLEWYNSDIVERVTKMWPRRPALFTGSKLKEIVLVVRPSLNPHEMPQLSPHCQSLLAHPRDAWGFVDYEQVRKDTDLFSDLDTLVIKENFEFYERELKKLFPHNLHGKVDFRFSVDLDCVSIGATDIEGAGSIYKRSFRN